MKKIYLFLVLLVSSAIYSQTQGITYQAVILNPEGQNIPGYNNQRAPLANKNICIRFNILAGTTLEYQETHLTTTDEFGMVNLVIGNGTSVGGSASTFAGIVWSGAPKNLKVEVDLKALCSNYTEISDQPLTAVPYAMYAVNSGSTGPQGPQGPQGIQGQTGATGPQGQVGATGPQGAQGPIGLTGPQGPVGANGSNGTDGKNALVNTTIEIASVNCPNGGTKIEVGIDINGNGVLDVSEINASQTKYVCNGAQGPAGANGVDGINGADGATGPQGPIGATGATGPQGIAGTNGVNGVDGAQGPIGLTGPQGPTGTNGINGATGPQGPIGLTGPAGQNGQNGTNGVDGLSAYQIWLNSGNTGTEAQFLASIQGAQGPIGLTGPAGPQGLQGVAGTNGTNGINGVDGATGLQGIQGEQGPIGLTGQAGPQGAAGVNGTNGIDGAQGPQGIQGPNGLNGIDGTTGPQGPIGLTGPAGANGLSAYEIAFQNGYTGTELQWLSANVGPQGPAGPQGVAGTNGINGINGIDGATGPQGPQGIQGLTGTAGPQGIQGPQGIAGTNGTNGVDGAQGTAGQNGINGQDGLSAYQIWLNAGNIGTEAQFLIALQGATGPQGIQGVTGAAGPQGTAGTNGINGATGPQGPAGANGINGTDGTNGTNGLSAYQVWLNLGNVGTEADFVASLTGPQGAQGIQGATGLLSNGTSSGNTPFWNGTTWIVNNSNIHNNGTEVGIGTANPNPSAKVEIASTTQGFLPSRMTSTQRNAITNPADGLIIFNTTSGCPNYYFNGVWYEWCGIGILPLGFISTLNCVSTTINGTLTEGVAASSVNSIVPYTGGNGGTHNSQTVTSTGVTGLTATLVSGTFANGSGSLTYNITGTPSANGTASFALNIGGQSCTLNINVNDNLVNQYPVNSVFCTSDPTAIVDVTNPTTGKIWMDRNLGASQVATSSTDALAYGDLYQWGRGNDGHQCRNSSTTSALSSTDQAGNGSFITASPPNNDWRSPQNNNLWQGVNGVNNPCPSGYRLPTETELNAEITSWSSNNAAGAFASPLKLTMTGGRASFGEFADVGTVGRYWSSTVGSTSSYFLFLTGSAFMNTTLRVYAFSVRCIKDASAIPATVGAINCGSTSVTGTLTNGIAASGVSLEVPYTGGNGGSYAAQTLSSTGVTGLTATLTSGTLAFGSGTLSFAISGTPSASGTASFALTIGGQTCSFTISVQTALAEQYPANSVFCASGPTAIVDVINPTTGKIWMDRNLGATRSAGNDVDTEAYGDLYQWGRANDGHQCRNSTTTGTISSNEQPGNGNFIITPNNPNTWRSSQTTLLWQGVNGVNNPCPSGYRLPSETELNNERASWVGNSQVGAFNSPLKILKAGYREAIFSNGLMVNVGTDGRYWTSTFNFNSAQYLYFSYNPSAGINTTNQSYGHSVRCIKN